MSERKSQLHELLAVEGDLAGVAKKIVEEAAHTFKNKGDHFYGSHKVLKMFDENKQNEEAAGESHKEMVTTVDQKLLYVFDHVMQYYDAILQKEATNQNARSDLVVDGVEIAKDVPATFLLGMESRLKVVRSMCESIPTFSPGIRWVEDTSRGEGVFRAEHPEVTNKTEQVLRFLEVSKATNQHKAQVETWKDNVPVGTYTSERWCGMYSPAQKSNILGRLDKLIQAVKQARQRANKTEVIGGKIGENIVNYIMEGV